MLQRSLANQKSTDNSARGARAGERRACWEGNEGHCGMDVLAGRRVVGGLYQPCSPLRNRRLGIRTDGWVLKEGGVGGALLRQREGG